MNTEWLSLLQLERTTSGDPVVGAGGASFIGRSHKRRAKAPVQATQPMLLMPQMLYPGMQACTQPPQQSKATASDASSSNTSDSDSVSLDTRRKYAKGAEAKITSSSKFIGRLPKLQLQELCESASGALDSTLTANLDEPTLCRLLYMATRVRPNTKICNLRAKGYKAPWHILGRKK